MKKLILSILVFVPLFSMSQTVDSLQKIIDNFKVENKTVSYVSVHTIEGTTKDELKKLMLRKLSSDSKLTISSSITIDDQIDGAFKELVLDYKKYGFSYFNIASWILHPASGSFTIQFKDDRYRIIIKGIQFEVQRDIIFDFNKDFVDKDGKLASTHKLNMRRSYFTLGSTFESWFKIDKAKKDDW